MADNGSSNGNVGTVEQVTGVVIDVAFPDHIPEIFHALKIDIEPEEGRTEQSLVCEGQQHLGDNRVRAIAMDATDGLRLGDTRVRASPRGPPAGPPRGNKVVDPGEPIRVPVGKATLARFFNLRGEP